MSSSLPSALDQVRQIRAFLRGLPSSSGSSSAASGASGSSFLDVHRRASAAAVAKVNDPFVEAGEATADSTADVKWRPVVPVGHTEFSWFGVTGLVDSASSSASSSSSSASSAAAKSGHRVGGLKAEKGVSDFARQAYAAVADHINKHAGQQKSARADVIGVAQQVVAGINFFLKLRFPNKAIVHARIYRDPTGQHSLAGVESEHTESDPIEYIEANVPQEQSNKGNAGRPLIGGMKLHEQVTDDAQRAFAAVLSEINKRASQPGDARPNIVKVGTQVVAGCVFFIKAQYLDGSCVHARIFRDLKGQHSLAGLECGHKLVDELAFVPPFAASGTVTKPQAEEKEPQQQQQQQKGKKQKSGRSGSQKKGGASNADNPPLSRLHFVVGKILKAWAHPDAASLWVEEIDVGEDQPRTICSGLVGKVALEDMIGADVVVVANLKPSKLRGIMSAGMVLAASEGDKAGLVKPPKGSLPGERVYTAGASEDELKLPPDESVNIQKKNAVWHVVAPKLRTNNKSEACYDGVPLVTSKGPCVAPGFADALVK